MVDSKTLERDIGYFYDLLERTANPLAKEDIKKHIVRLEEELAQHKDKILLTE